MFNSHSTGDMPWFIMKNHQSADPFTSPFLNRAIVFIPQTKKISPRIHFVLSLIQDINSVIKECSQLFKNGRRNRCIRTSDKDSAYHFKMLYSLKRVL